MELDHILIRGAREHNLRIVDLEHPQEAARRVHRRLGLGQVVARLRHALRRGPAPLRRVAVRVRAAVPRPDGEAEVRARSAGCRRPSRSSRRARRRTRARPSAPSPRSTTTCACSTRASASSTATSAAARCSAQSAAARSSTSCCALPAGTTRHAARAEGREPQGRVPRAASTSCARPASCACASTAMIVRLEDVAGARQEARSTRSRSWSTASTIGPGDAARA